MYFYGIAAAVRQSNPLIEVVTNWDKIIPLREGALVLYYYVQSSTDLLTHRSTILGSFVDLYEHYQ